MSVDLTSSEVEERYRGTFQERWKEKFQSFMELDDILDLSREVAGIRTMVALALEDVDEEARVTPRLVLDLTDAFTRVGQTAERIHRIRESKAITVAELSALGLMIRVILERYLSDPKICRAALNELYTLIPNANSLEVVKMMRLPPPTQPVIDADGPEFGKRSVSD